MEERQRERSLGQDGSVCEDQPVNGQSDHLTQDGNYYQEIQPVLVQPNTGAVAADVFLLVFAGVFGRASKNSFPIW